MTTDYLPEMTRYWNHRYAAEGTIWGTRESPIAALALEFFAREAGDRLLVPGAGYGRHTRFFADRHYQVTGVEISDEAVKLAARHDPRTTWLNGSFLEVEPAEESFDFIYCFNVLHLFRENERRLFIERCFSLLRKNGVIFLTVFSEMEESFGRGDMVEANTFASKPGRPVHYFTEDDLISTFSRFSILKKGIIEDEENHGPEGPHTHLLRYVYARKSSLDFDAHKYKEHSKHTKEWGGRIVSELRLAGNESVLDLGCGDGVITRRLADLLPGGRVLGLDSSRSMIREAEKLAGSNLSFRLQDIGDLNNHEEFDLIFSNAALHWVKDHHPVLEKCYTALKKNGRIRFSFGSQGNCSNFIAVTRELISSEEFASHFRNFQWPWFMPGAPEYRDIIARFPYISTKVWEENADTHFAGVDELAGWIDQPSIVPFLRHLDENDRSRFRDRVLERMISLTRQDDGRCFETFRRLNVLARK